MRSKLINRWLLITAGALFFSLIFYRYVIYRKSFNLYAHLTDPIRYEIEIALNRQKLKEKIYKAHPQLENGGLTDWQKVNLLREWVYKNTNASSPALNINHRVPKTAIADIFSVFSEEKVGIDCGGVSDILMRVYNAFGYDSYLYIAGREKKYHHVVTLVKIRDEGKDIIVLQDGLLNLTYTDANGDPHDVAGLFQSIRDRKWEEVKAVQPKATRKYVGISSTSVNTSWYGKTVEKQLSDTEYIVSNPPLADGYVANLPYCRNIYTPRFDPFFLPDITRIHAACDEI